jgi:hypothetical protein
MNTQNVKYYSPRKFVLFSYSASHGLLLLRSGKANEHPTRVDILVQDVRALEIRCWFEGVQIEEVGRDYLLGFKSNPTEMLEPGNKVYSVQGNGWQGFIVGGVFASHEDEDEFAAPSKLLPRIVDD